MQIQFDPLDPLALLCMHTNYGAKGSKGSNHTLLSGSRCSGKLKLDTEGVIFVQKMYNERQ